MTIKINCFTDDDEVGHTCPYKSDVNGDNTSLCTCTPEQTRQCANDV